MGPGFLLTVIGDPTFIANRSRELCKVFFCEKKGNLDLKGSVFAWKPLIPAVLYFLKHPDDLATGI